MEEIVQQNAENQSQDENEDKKENWNDVSQETTKVKEALNDEFQVFSAEHLAGHSIFFKKSVQDKITTPANLVKSSRKNTRIEHLFQLLNFYTKYEINEFNEKVKDDSGVTIDDMFDVFMQNYYFIFFYLKFSNLKLKNYVKQIEDREKYVKFLDKIHKIMNVHSHEFDKFAQNSTSSVKKTIKSLAIHQNDLTKNDFTLIHDVYAWINRKYHDGTYNIKLEKYTEKICIDNPAKVELIDVSGLECVRNENFEALENVKKVKINDCNSIYLSDKIFEKCKDICFLSMKNCDQFTFTDNMISHLDLLKLDITNCCQFTSKLVEKQKNLVKLVINGCRQNFGNVEKHVAIKFLSMKDSPQFGISNMKKMGKLEHINVKWSPTLLDDDLFSFLQFERNTKYLNISNCTVEIKMFEYFNNASTIIMNNCKIELPANFDPVNEGVVKPLFSKFKNLKILEMENIKSEISESSIFINLEKLEKLDISNNNFETNIFENFNDLQTLIMQKCNYEHLEKIEKLKNLQKLDIGNGEYGVTIKLSPPIFENITELYVNNSSIVVDQQQNINTSKLLVFHAKNSAISNNVMEFIGKFENLTVLDLENAKLEVYENNISPHLKNLAKLKILNVNNTEVVFTKPLDIEQAEIEQFSANKCSFYDEQLFFKNLSSQQLEIENTGVNEKMFENKNLCSSIKNLNVSGNNFDGLFLLECKKLTSLVANNSFNGQTRKLNIFSKLYNLKNLEISANEQQSFVLNENTFRNMKELEHLKIENSQISDLNFDYLHNLQTLKLENVFYKRKNDDNITVDEFECDHNNEKYFVKQNFDNIFRNLKKLEHLTLTVDQNNFNTNAVLFNFEHLVKLQSLVIDAASIFNASDNEHINQIKINGNLSENELSQIANKRKFEMCKNLMCLEITNVEEELMNNYDLKFVENMKNLRYLKFIYSDKSNIKLSNLKQLTKLHIQEYDNALSDDVGRLKLLESLTLDEENNKTNLQKITFAYGGHMLKHFHTTKKIDNVEHFFDDLKYLECLHIRSTDKAKLKDYEPFFSISFDEINKNENCKPK